MEKYQWHEVWYVPWIFVSLRFANRKKSLSNRENGSRGGVWAKFNQKTWFLQTQSHRFFFLLASSYRPFFPIFRGNLSVRFCAYLSNLRFSFSLFISRGWLGKIPSQSFSPSHVFTRVSKRFSIMTWCPGWHLTHFFSRWLGLFKNMFSARSRSLFPFFCGRFFTWATN